MKRWISLATAGLILGAAATQAAQVGLIKIDGAIGPATASYISRAIDTAAAQNDECLIIQLNTPGGLVDSAAQIVQAFYDSKAPIVVYVAPAPARAGSAGVFITMAADVAAMAPSTRIGAAHPVELGTGGEVENPGKTMETKIENDTAIFAKTIAEKRHRNANWAMASVRESVSTNAEAALQLNVIDLIANDLPDLLKKLDGRKVGDKILHTATATVVEIPMNAWEQFSRLFLRPEVMFILMLVVIYGFIGELSSPGAILPGVAGAIALLLVLYMSSILPVNVTGLVLDRAGDHVVHRGHFCADARCVDRGRHRGFFPRGDDAVQPGRTGLWLVTVLDRSGDTHHGGIFCIRCRQGHSRAIQTHPGRQGNDARPDRQRAMPD